MKGRSYVDFHEVLPQHADIHARLENWARWCRNRPTLGTHPMFRAAKSGQDWEPVDVATRVDTIDAMRVEKAVAALPQRHQAAIRWCYVYRTAPRQMAQKLGETLVGLAELVRDGRQMLVNRRA